MLSLPDGGVWGLVATDLCRLHRNEPGWFVGEHMHARFGPAAGFLSTRVVMEMDRFCERL